jgi:hypothetical protein
MGEFGILLVKDFGGILSLTRETRGPILAALREVYDGAWTRYVGTDGGRTLHWEGKAGLLGGATPAIDGHYGVMAALGERFLYYRLPEDDSEEMAQAALAHSGQEGEMRRELAQRVARLFVGFELLPPRPLTSTETDRIVALASFTARCRSAVERESYQTREIQLIPGKEVPTRLAKALYQLLNGLERIGVQRARAWELVSKVALDSMPLIRQEVVVALLKREDPATAPVLATDLGYPTSTTRRSLEDLACYGVVARTSQGEGRADLWLATDWTRTTYRKATTVPEILPTGCGCAPITNTSNTKPRISDMVPFEDMVEV